MFFLSAILLGLASSLHCIGMCGPLLSILPWYNGGNFSITPALLHHGGRLIAYASLGVLGGFVGQSVAFLGFSQWLSIIAGVIILLAILFKKKLDGSIQWILRPIKTLNQQSGIGKNGKLFSLGVLNGYLPCGMVYMAIGASVAGGSVADGVIYMLFFGLGTLPALLGLSVIQSYIGSRWKNVWKKGTQALLVVMAVLFIVRGLNIGIPYLSPKFEPEKKEMKCH